MKVFEELGTAHAEEMMMVDLGISGFRPRYPLSGSKLPRAQSFAAGAQFMFDAILDIIQRRLREEVNLLDIKFHLSIESDNAIFQQRGRIDSLRELGGLIKALGGE